MPPDPPATGRRILRCDKCGWTQTATRSDLSRYADEGCPTCCGQPMNVYAEPERPRPADSEDPTTP